MSQRIKVRVTKPQIVIQGGMRVKNAIAFLAAKVIPARYVWATIKQEPLGIPAKEPAESTKTKI